MKPVDMQQLAETLRAEFPGQVEMNAPLAGHTSYQVGGPAAIFARPANQSSLKEMVNRCAAAGAPVFILGSGSNILVHDRGVNAVVIHLGECCSAISHSGKTVYAGAGALLQNLVTYCEQHQLAGLDFMSGIPGTVGGALRMNAGAFVGEIGDRVDRIEALTFSGEYREIDPTEAGFGYRRADGLQDKILLGCWLQMEEGRQADLEKARFGYLEKRSGRQPLEYGSCGSVFKRPPGNFAGTLIEQAGCKGRQVGGAMVSPKHANFIVNYQDASADDIFKLIQIVQQEVYQKFSVWLELEVKLVGFTPKEEKLVRKPHE